MAETQGGAGRVPPTFEQGGANFFALAQHPPFIHHKDLTGKDIS